MQVSYYKVVSENKKLRAENAELADRAEAWEAETMAMREPFPDGVPEAKEAKIALAEKRVATDQAIPCKLHPFHTYACQETVWEFKARIERGEDLGQAYRELMEQHGLRSVRL